MYDSRVDTYEHIWEVQKRLQHVINLLHLRALYHDRSKLESPEKEGFDKATVRLKEVEYGSPEYAASLEDLKETLQYHYSHPLNLHHPEHHKDGIRGMNLIDIVEMLCDWAAATLRSPLGDIRQSIEKNQQRFGYSDELRQILLNTVDYIEGK